MRNRDEEWARAPVASLAQKYDRVDAHGWYANLDPTTDDVGDWLADGKLLVDYSGGTGILVDRLLTRVGPSLNIGVVNVDSSPKFLRLSLDKFRDEPRVGHRLLAFVKEEKRLQFLDEAVPELVGRADAIVSANAVHLYHDLVPTLRGWYRTLRREGRVFVQSGNIHGDDGGTIIDSTVDALDREARRIAASDERFARYRPALADDRYHDLRKRFFLPARPVAYYTNALEEAGFSILHQERRPVRARASEWRDFLWVYHEGILGWVGGSAKIDAHEPDARALADRRALFDEALAAALGGRDAFDATWTYLTCAPR